MSECITAQHLRYASLVIHALERSPSIQVLRNWKSNDNPPTYSKTLAFPNPKA
jgi:hypothetical protein